jgi:hypothetical protein
MTTEDDQENSSLAPALVQEIEAIPDPALLALVDALNTFDSDSSSIGITLDVSGVIVTGKLVGAAVFFDAMEKMLEAAGQPEFADAFAKPHADLMREEAAHDDGSDDRLRPRFIHLVDARVVTSNDARPIPRQLWRGRLSHVSGWSVGILEVEPR